MIKVENSVFKVSADAESGIFIKQGLYLFITLYLSGKGEAIASAYWSFEADAQRDGQQFTLPNQTAESLDGGVGDTCYDQMIDKMEDIAIAYLSTFNPSCTFTKIK